jgi:hypothetical protein
MRQTAKEVRETKADLLMEIGILVYGQLSQDQPKRFKAFAETLMNGLPPRFKLQFRLVHDSDWVAGITDELEGEGSLAELATPAIFVNDCEGLVS